VHQGWSRGGKPLQISFPCLWSNEHCHCDAIDRRVGSDSPAPVRIRRLVMVAKVGSTTALRASSHPTLLGLGFGRAGVAAAALQARPVPGGVGRRHICHPAGGATSQFPPTCLGLGLGRAGVAAATLGFGFLKLPFASSALRT
jgi:hypothetical protein